jgi:hypothetical protein
MSAGDGVRLVEQTVTYLAGEQVVEVGFERLEVLHAVISRLPLVPLRRSHLHLICLARPRFLVGLPHQLRLQAVSAGGPRGLCGLASGTG